MKSLKIFFPVFLAFMILPFVNGQVITDESVFGNWNFTLKPEVKTDRFEKFMVEEYIPAFEKYFTGVQMILAKGDRGVEKDGYCVLLLFKSIEERNQWWPSDGISSDKAKAAAAQMKVQDDRLNMMITWESFTDWFVL
jgi:hypothetical protein